MFLLIVSVRSVAGKGPVICTRTAVLKPKNNPQSAVHCEQSVPIATEQPSGGKPAKTVEWTHMLNLRTSIPDRRGTNK